MPVSRSPASHEQSFPLIPRSLGFLALAQLPPVFLFATKNSLLSMALGAGRGWEKLNFLHRWAGRGLFLSATVHGSLWIRNHLQFGLPIIGQQKESSGVAALGLLCVIVLTSLRPVRVWAFQFFFVMQCVIFHYIFFSLCLKLAAQHTRIRRFLHHDLLSHDLRPAVDLPAIGFLRP